MADLSFRSAATDGDTSFGSATDIATVPSGTAVNDLGVIWYSSAVVAPAVAPSHTAPAGWYLGGSFVYNGLAGTLNARLTMYYRIEEASPASATLTSSAVAAHAWTRASYQNPDRRGVFGQVNFNSWTGTSVVASAMTTSRDNALIAMYVIQGVAQALTPDGSLTERSDNATYAVELADAIQATAGTTGSKTATAPTSSDGVWGFAEFWSEVIDTSTKTQPPANIRHSEGGHRRNWDQTGWFNTRADQLGWFYREWTPTAATGAQTLTASLFTNTNTFYAHTLVRGAVTLTPSLFTNSNTFYTHVISQGGATQTLTASLFTNTNSFYAHTINAGAVTLTPSLFSNTNSFYAHTLNRGTVTLSPSLFSNANSFYTHAVTPGVVALTAALFSNFNAFYTHTIVQAGGPQTLLPNLFLNDNTFYDHEITQTSDLVVPIFYSGGAVDLPTGRRRTKKQLQEEREKWGVIPKQAKVIIKRVAAQQYEAPDNTEALIAAFGRAELAYKTQYAALYRMEVERQLAMMREEEEFILLH